MLEIAQERHFTVKYAMDGDFAGTTSKSNLSSLGRFWADLANSFGSEQQKTLLEHMRWSKVKNVKIPFLQEPKTGEMGGTGPGTGTGPTRTRFSLFLPVLSHVTSDRLFLPDLAFQVYSGHFCPSWPCLESQK